MVVIVPLWRLRQAIKQNSLVSWRNQDGREFQGHLLQEGEGRKFRFNGSTKDGRTGIVLWVDASELSIVE